MIPGWSKLQLPLPAESHCRGFFTPPLSSVASGSSFKEQSFVLCRSFVDRGGFDPQNDSSFSPELKASLVENLVGALINATEILDDYAQTSGVPAAIKWLLGFEASLQDQEFALASNSLVHNESLELLSDERLSRGSSAQASVSPSFGDAISTSYCLQRRAASSHAARSPPTLHIGGISQGHRELSTKTSCSAGHGYGNSRNSNSEEDLLLQEARSRTFRSRTEPGEGKSSRSTRVSSDCLAKSFNRGSTKRNKVHSGTESAWPFAEIMRPSQQNSVFLGWIALGMLLTGALQVMCRSKFSIGRQSQKPSVKRRILKSQWYGNPGSHSWEHKNFQMRISEFPKYPLLEVDGDKKLLRVPSESARKSTAFATRDRQPLERKQPLQKQHIRQTIHGTGLNQVSLSNKAQGQPIRQTIHSSKALPRKQLGPISAQSNNALNGGTSVLQWPEAPEEERKDAVLQPRLLRFHGRSIQDSTDYETTNQENVKINASKSRSDQGQWGKDDELDLDQRIQKLYQKIQAVEHHRRAAMLALEEERQRSLALEQEISKQREVAAALGKEVRLLKESHSALLISLRKKYSTSAAARTAADLVYQDWERQVAVD